MLKKKKYVDICHVELCLVTGWNFAVILLRKEEKYVSEERFVQMLGDQKVHTRTQEERFKLEIHTR